MKRLTSLVIRMQKMFFLTSVFILCFRARSRTHASEPPSDDAAAMKKRSHPYLTNNYSNARCPVPLLALASRPDHADPTIHHRPGHKKNKSNPHTHTHTHTTHTHHTHTHTTHTHTHTTIDLGTRKINQIHIHTHTPHTHTQTHTFFICFKQVLKCDFQLSLILLPCKYVDS